VKILNLDGPKTLSTAGAGMIQNRPSRASRKAKGVKEGFGELRRIQAGRGLRRLEMARGT
jgi:hypothetical protein